MTNKKFTTSFLSLIENLNSPVYRVEEDKETRQKEREKRRQGRRERRFEEKGDLRSFIQNLETLKSQIIANVVDTDHWIEQNPDSSVYPDHKKTFLDLLERVAKVMGDAIYISKKEGKKLETEDQDLLTGLNDTYNDIKGEYESAAEKYSTASTQEIITGQKELKFKDISAKLIAAARYFQEAAQENLKLLDTLKADASGTTTTSSVSDIKIEAPIKKGTGSKKSPDERVKSVQKAILDKFKNNKDVTASQVWKNFARYKPDGIFGNATTGIIIALKAGFRMSDTTPDITQDFVNKLSEVKESLSESRVIGFLDFMRIKEDFDIEAFNKYVRENPAPKPKKKKGSSDKERELEGFRKAEEEYAKKRREEKKGEEKEAVKSYDMDKIKEMAFNIFLSFVGMDEDEKAFFSEIKKIKDSREFELLEENFEKMKIQKTDLQAHRNVFKKRDWQYMVDKNKDTKSTQSLRNCVEDYFNSGEIARLNSYLPDGVEKF